MDTTDIINVLLRIDKLIQSGKPMTPVDFCNACAISERQFYEYLNMMKILGAPVKFDRRQKRYIYSEPGIFKAGFLRNPENKTYRYEIGEGRDEDDY